jgi:hypothetical protein
VPILKRVRNILRYGLGDEARERKRADKRAAKRQRFESGRWDRDDDFARRRYESYEDYLRHQASKLDRVEERLRENEAAELEEFTARFQDSPALIGARTVLCLGARLGTEVRALHGLGRRDSGGGSGGSCSASLAARFVCGGGPQALPARGNRGAPRSPPTPRS